MVPDDGVDVVVLPREVVRRTANIMGPTSAAALALADVRVNHGGRAEVCQGVGEALLLVIPHTDLLAAGWTQASSRASDTTIDARDRLS